VGRRKSYQRDCPLFVTVMHFHRFILMPEHQDMKLYVDVEFKFPCKMYKTQRETGTQNYDYGISAERTILSFKNKRMNSIKTDGK
jgi:hypothetical protein